MTSPRAKPNSASKAAKKNELIKRRLDVSELLLLRIPQFQIAEKLGLSEASVSEAVALIRSDWKRRHAEKVDVIQARELAALDADETRLRKWLMATSPDQDRARGRYMEILLKIAERRAKVAGLDAPTKAESKVEHRAACAFTDDVAKILSDPEATTKLLDAVQGSVVKVVDARPDQSGEAQP